MSKPVHVQTYSLSPEGWPSGKSLRIVMVADVHACWPWTPVQKVAEIVAQANALGGDLICLMGDYVGHVLGGFAVDKAEVVQELAKLDAPLGRYAVFGNHDWHDDKEAKSSRLGETMWHRLFAEAGIPTLSNSHVALDLGGAGLTLVGLESQRAFHSRFQRPIEGADDLELALSGADLEQFTLLLAHEPDVFADLPDGVDLTLSGHTHGGQILLAGYPAVVPSKYGARFAYGHHQIGARDLVVSGGLGYSGVPLRWGVPPELTVVELS